jgi:hypothetical protein
MEFMSTHKNNANFCTDCPTYIKYCFNCVNYTVKPLRVDGICCCDCLNSKLALIPNQVGIRNCKDIEASLSQYHLNSKDK